MYVTIFNKSKLGRREIVGVKFTSQKNVCLVCGKNASWKKCLLENTCMPPEYFVTRKKCLLRKKVLSSIIILQVHITTSEAFSFFHLSLIVANVCQKFTVFYPFCLAVERYLSFSCKVSVARFCWFFSLFWLAAHS